MATIIYTLLYAALCVAQAGIFGFCMYRALSLGRAYEKELGEKYPAIAEKRRADPFSRMTFPGLPVYRHLTGEDELDDAPLQRKRKAVFCYFIGACMIVCLPALVALTVRGL